VILPSKKLRPGSSLIYIGARILILLDEPKTVSRLWEDLKKDYVGNSSTDAVAFPYDWFVLALDLLFAMGAIVLSQGRLYRNQL
jgi:hypothetical protein